MKTAMWVFAAVLCLLGACAATESPPAPAVAAPPTVLTWGADTTEKYVYALPQLTRVEPKADVLAAVLAAADADPLITAHASTDAGAGQAVYSTPVPGWLTAAMDSHKAEHFGSPATLARSHALLLVREAALSALQRALAALNTGWHPHVTLVAPAGQGASTQLLTLATMALVEASGANATGAGAGAGAGVDLLLYKGPAPTGGPRGQSALHQQRFLHFAPGNTTATAYESVAAVKAAGLNKRSTVLVYDGNAKLEPAVVGALGWAQTLTALGYGGDDTAFASSRYSAERVHVPPLAPREFAAVVGAVFPERTAEDVGLAVRRFGLSVRHAVFSKWDTADAMVRAAQAARHYLLATAREDRHLQGDTDGELLEYGHADHHNATGGDSTKGLGLRALMPAVREDGAGDSGCVFASAEARLAVFEAAAWAFAENRAEAEKESRAYALAVLRCAGGVLNVIVAFVIIYRTNKETQKTIAALATLVAPAAPATFAAVV